MHLHPIWYFIAVPLVLFIMVGGFYVMAYLIAVMFPFAVIAMAIYGLIHLFGKDNSRK